jgi:hypothetical protein
VNPPSVFDVVLGSLSVAIACVGAAASLRTAVRGGNWLAYICLLGCLAFIAGVIGQRTFPSLQARQQLGGAASQSTPGPWDAGISIPLLGWHITPVALAGLLVTAVGVALLLLFEHVPDALAQPRPELRPLEDDDSV